MKVKPNIITVFIILSIIVVANNLFLKSEKANEHKISFLLNAIKENYVDSIDMNSLVESSIEQTLKNLDPHSIYMDINQVQSSMEMMQGSFEGIGVEFSIQKDTIVIMNVIPNGPSDKIGLMAGARIVSIEGENVAGIGITNEDVIKKLRGERGTTVIIDIQSQYQKNSKNVKIIRGKIPLNSLDVSYEIDPNIGYIKLNRFSETTFREFKNELEILLKESQIHSLILDLRGNSGGYLDQAVKILNEFFEKDKLLVFTKGQFRPEYKYFSNKEGCYKEGDICVLIDEGSASASEIIAGAIQDHNRGLIVGERSFGKGLVQEQITLNDGSLIRLTVARYYTPSGRCIQKPYSQEAEDEYYYNSIESIDSLQVFSTKNGTVVYGGGGIEPDHNIEQEHEQLPTGLIYLYSSNFLNDLVFEFVDSNRKILQQKKFSEWEMSTNETNLMNIKIMEWIKAELSDDPEIVSQISQNTDKINNRIHALIIRQYWGWEEMQMFLNETDQIVISSVSLLKK
ncbi:S41 family peptidase [Flavobacteriales bacterium]|nr:S41 family peptidase [Flavobacteriales bacterium]